MNSSPDEGLRNSAPKDEVFAGFALAFGDAAAAGFAGCLVAGDLTMEDLGVSLLFLDVLRPLAGMV